MQVPPFSHGSDWQSSTSAREKERERERKLNRRRVADLIRVQIKRMYSAEEMLFIKRERACGRPLPFKL